MTARIVAVASGGGSVLDICMRHDPLVRTQIVSLVADRQCEAIPMAMSYGVPVLRIFEEDNGRFSQGLLQHCVEVEADYVALFFNRLLRGQMLARYPHRIINIHASLLPAFKGLRAFSEALRFGARFLGTTIHFVDEFMDEGQVILQSVTPLDPREDPLVLRHRQFQQMCKGFIQVCHWLGEGRVRAIDNRVEVVGAQFNQADFSPALEREEALLLSVPRPVLGPRL